MTPRSGKLIRWTVFLLGCALGVAVVLSGRVPEGHAPAGVDLALSARPSAKLGVSPAGTDFLRGRDLDPGASPVRGRLRVSNYALAPVVAQMRLTGRDADLDALVEAVVRADNKTVFRGRLRELRSWGAVRFTLAPKQRRKLTLHAWLPGSVRRDYQGRSAELELEWRTARVES
jgi:hypothetical protein